MEYFVFPGEDEKWHKYWINECLEWYKSIGINPKKLRVRQHDSTEMAHYSKATFDLEYEFPWGWGEIQGIANRTDFDLKAHIEGSGESLTYFDDSTGERFVPYVIEPSAGVDRAVLAFLSDAYTVEEVPNTKGGHDQRVLLKLHTSLAPVKVAVLPLSRNERLAPLAREVFDRIRTSGVARGFVEFDDAQSIGRRYRRQDETGTPLCVTVDFTSLEDGAVTIRERDTMSQVRVAIGDLEEQISWRLLN